MRSGRGGLHRVFPLLPALLGGCAQPDPLAVLGRFDPDVTTVPMEQARVLALQSGGRVNVTPGTYCFAFEDPQRGGAVSGRIELTLRPGKTFQYADRYVYRGVVRARNETGTYLITGHALSMVSAAGTERTFPLTTATPEALNLWGATPLTRQACRQDPVTGQVLQGLLKTAQGEQTRPVPWAAPASTPDLNATPPRP